MPKPPPPPTAFAAKTDLREASWVAREARKQWTQMRDIYRDSRTPTTTDVGYATLRMWAAEKDLAVSAARWRDILAERTAMPVADRWDLAALERWASAKPCVGDVWISSCVTHQGLRWKVVGVANDVAVFRDMERTEHSCHVGFSQLVYGWSREVKL